MSCAIASSIFRMFSACCSSWVWVENLDSFVTPSTSWATSGPNSSSMSARLSSVSSGTSCRSAASIEAESSPISARVKAAAIGWVTYGSPVARTCPSWAATAKSRAFPTVVVSAPGEPSATAASSSRRRTGIGRLAVRSRRLGERGRAGATGASAGGGAAAGSCSSDIGPPRIAGQHAGTARGGLGGPDGPPSCPRLAVG